MGDDKTAADDFFILSLRWTRGTEVVLTWWAPDNNGYTSNVDLAGRYSRERVEGNRAYYDNGDTTLAVPCSAVEAKAHRVVGDFNLEALTGKRFADVLDDEGDQCEACGQEPQRRRLGIRVVGTVAS